MSARRRVKCAITGCKNPVSLRFTHPVRPGVLTLLVYTCEEHRIDGRKRITMMSAVDVVDGYGDPPAEPPQI